MQYLKPKITQPQAKQVEHRSEKKSGINEIICPQSCSPIWQKAFALADNVRFTRTPDSEMIRRRAAIDPVYAKILAEAEAAKALYRQQSEKEKQAAAAVSAAAPVSAAGETAAVAPAAGGSPSSALFGSAPVAAVSAVAPVSAAGEAAAVAPVLGFSRSLNTGLDKQNSGNTAARPKNMPPAAAISGKDPVINKGYESIEQMRHNAAAAFGGEDSGRNASVEDSILVSPEAAKEAVTADCAAHSPVSGVTAAEPAPALPQTAAKVIYADNGRFNPVPEQPAAPAPLAAAPQPVAAPPAMSGPPAAAIAAGVLFPWSRQDDKSRAEVLLAGAAIKPDSPLLAEDGRRPVPAACQAAALPGAGQAPAAPVAAQMDITRLFKSMECRQPQMRWVPVPAHGAGRLAVEPVLPANRQDQPVEIYKSAAATGAFVSLSQPGAVFYLANPAEIGGNTGDSAGTHYTALAASQSPTLNLQFKLGGYNSRDSFTWEHIQAAPAPLSPQNPAGNDREGNLDSLCSSAVEHTAKAAAALAPQAMPAAARPAAPALAEQAGKRAGQAEAAEKPRRAALLPPGAEARYGYRLPPLDLLQDPVYHEENTISQESLERSAGLLETVLEDFGVRGEIIHVRPGPVVTLYEFEPAPGVKSSRVIGLSDDIARSMSAVAARVAVIPGRNVIGIELPNKKRETVYLREILQSAAYKTSDYKLSLALGKNIGGEPIIAELARMPHLLVAGTTGSGKSVAINTMILSLIYRLTPQECRLIMVDPKMLELSVYDGIPHLLTPVVTDPKKALSALKWAVREMEDRYRKMARLGVRNIDGFNARIKDALHKNETIMCTVQAGFDKETGELLYTEEAIELKPLPYIVIIVDEMADLMMVAGKEIEGAIQRLAQMARAAGIHLIMATQRPSVDVITGTIKANFPTRISFQVTSKIDSRTILGEQGAETLLGQGDMLHMAGGGRLKRVHGPFVSDREVEKVVAHLKTQGTPEYLATVTESNDDEATDSKGKAEGGEEHSAIADIVAAAGGGDDFDDLYIQAVKIVMRDKKCSTSYIQRRLGIGYNKAATLVEKMEEEGLVGEANHVGKREILINN